MELELKLDFGVFLRMNHFGMTSRAVLYILTLLMVLDLRIGLGSKFIIETCILFKEIALISWI